MLQINGCVNRPIRRVMPQLVECRLGGGGKIGHHNAGDQRAAFSR